jgi:hypothetical protein
MSGIDRHDNGTTEKRASPRRAGPLAVALATVALVAAACGGGSSNSPGVAGAGSSTTTQAASASASPGGPGSGSNAPLEFAQCMRSHGVTSFPDPTANGNGQFGGNVSPGSGVDPNSPTFQAAQKACSKYLSKGTPAQQAQHQAQMLKYAECMRSHGVTNFPDPSSSGGFDIGPGIKANSSTYKAADSACQSLRTSGSGG